MSWERALETATRLLEAQTKRVTASDADAYAILAGAAKLLAEESPAITALAHQQGFADLGNRMSVAIDIFVSYARRPDRQEPRLLRLIDEHLRLLILELRQLAARTGANLQAAIGIFPASAGTAALFLLAATDGNLRFGTDEPLARVRDDAQADAKRIEDIFRKRSDARFQFRAKRPVEGFQDLGYELEGDFHFVKQIVAGNATPADRAEVETVIQTAQNDAFPTFPGVAKLQKFMTALGLVRTASAQTTETPRLPVMA